MVTAPQEFKIQRHQKRPHCSRSHNERSLANTSAQRTQRTTGASTYQAEMRNGASLTGLTKKEQNRYLHSWVHSENMMKADLSCRRALLISKDWNRLLLIPFAH